MLFLRLIQLAVATLLMLMMTFPVTEGWSATPVETENHKKPLVLAVIDTGVDPHHPYLSHFIWENQGEQGMDDKGRDKATNGVDDDRNGFIDDVHGWNFVDQTNKVMDFDGHGTHVTGIIKKMVDSPVIHSPSKRPIRVMVLKYFDAKKSGQKSMLHYLEAVQYALNMGADIISYSGGGKKYNRFEYSMIKKAADKGVLFITAAGNKGPNESNEAFYPAAYPLDNIISVVSLNSVSGQILDTSNYGKKWAHLGAPGFKIYSSLPNHAFGYLTGTSQATAFVAGAAAVIASVTPFDQTKDLKEKLIRFCHALPNLKEKTKLAVGLMPDEFFKRF